MTDVENMLADLIPLADAAERKGVRKQTLVEAGKRGEIEIVKVAGQWYAAEKSLRKWCPRRGCHDYR